MSIASQVYKIIKKEGTLPVKALYERFPNTCKATIRGALHSSEKKLESQTNPTFSEFVNAEAWPRPSKEITNEWVGILDHQAEIFTVFEANDIVMLNWLRGGGKTWVVAWYIEYTMKYYGQSWLYLSLTEVRYRVAQWVYTWAFTEGLISTSADGPSYDRRNSYQKFEIENGARFEAHSVTSKAILGFHGYNIIMDDVIDKQHQARPSMQRDLENQWNYTLSKITRGKLIIVGTRKFKMDFLEYLIIQFGDALVLDIKTPYNEDGSLLAPELHTIEYLDAMKARDIVSWFAEMMQEPKPIEGGDWDNVHYTLSHSGKLDYDWAVIAIDRATTQNKTSDETGFVVILRERGKYKYVILRDLTSKMTFEFTKDKIQEVYDQLRDFFLECGVIVRMEKQGGGEDLYNSALTTNYKWASHCHLVHSQRNKEDKIRDALGSAEEINKTKFLKNVKVVENLRGSKVVEQIRTFPGCLAYQDDAIDAAAMGIMELEDMYLTNKKWSFT